MKVIEEYAHYGIMVCATTLGVIYIYLVGQFLKGI